LRILIGQICGPMKRFLGCIFCLINLDWPKLLCWRMGSQAGPFV